MSITATNAATGSSSLASISDVKMAAKKTIDLEEEHTIPGLPRLDVVMTKGEGAFLYDLAGNKYIDFNGGFSSCNQGHCHPKIVAAMMEQCGKLALPSRAAYNSSTAPLLERISELTGFGKVSLLSTGVEATDMAVKLARAWGYKVKGIPADEAIILMTEDNFHGRSLSILSGSTNQWEKTNCGPFLSNVGPYCAGNKVRFGNADDLEEAFKAKGDKIAGFFIETVQGHSGCHDPGDEYLIKVRELCTKYNVLMMCDEIQSGLGRAGYFLAYMSAGIQPDLVALGKSMSGGLYPVSAVVGKTEVMSALDDGQYGATYSGNPLGCAVSLAAINVIVDEKLPEKARELGVAFVARAKEIKSPYFGGITGKGLFRAIWLRPDQTIVTPKALAQRCLELGLFVSYSTNRLRTCPPLVISNEDMIKGIDIIEQAMNDLAAESKTT